MQGTMQSGRIASSSSSSGCAIGARSSSSGAAAVARIRRSRANTTRVAASGGGVDLAREKISLPPPPPPSKGATFKVTLVAANDDKRSFDCPDNEYILSAAEAAGFDLPATCRAGICGACVARRSSGTTDMSDIADLSFTLSDGEIEQGMTLLCMARATSDCTFETQSDWGYSLGVAEWKGATGAFESRPDPLMGTSWAADEDGGSGNGGSK